MFNGSLEGQIVSNPAYQKSDFAMGSNSSKDFEFTSSDQNSDFIEPIEFSNTLKSRRIRREDIHLDKIENNWSHVLRLQEVGQGNFSVVIRPTPEYLVFKMENISIEKISILQKLWDRGIKPYMSNFESSVLCELEEAIANKAKVEIKDVSPETRAKAAELAQLFKSKMKILMSSTAVCM